MTREDSKRLLVGLRLHLNRFARGRCVGVPDPSMRAAQQNSEESVSIAADNRLPQYQRMLYPRSAQSNA